MKSIKNYLLDIFQNPDQRSYRSRKGGTWYRFLRHGDIRNHMNDTYWCQNSDGDGLSACTLINTETHDK